MVVFAQISVLSVTYFHCHFAETQNIGKVEWGGGGRREKQAIKGAAKANVGDRKGMGSAVIAHSHIKVGCCRIRSLSRCTDKRRI